MKRQEIIFAVTSLFVGLILLILAIVFYLYTEKVSYLWSVVYTYPLREYSVIVGGVGLTLVLLGLFYRTSDGFFIVAVTGGYENVRGFEEKRLEFCTACGKQTFKGEKFCPSCGEPLEKNP